MLDPKQAYDSIANDFLLEHYKEHDPRTWPFFPIVMPSKNNKGPVSSKECDAIDWEVWDQYCVSYSTYSFLFQAIEAAMLLNKEWLEATKKGG